MKRIIALVVLLLFAGTIGGTTSGCFFRSRNRGHRHKRHKRNKRYKKKKHKKCHRGRHKNGRCRH